MDPACPDYSDYQKYVPIDHLWVRCGQVRHRSLADLTAPNSMVRLTEHYFGNHYKGDFTVNFDAVLRGGSFLIPASFR